MGRRRLDHTDQELLWPIPEADDYEEDPFRIDLRYYQDEAVAAIFKQWETHRSVLLHMATGTGKTVIFSDIARQCIGRVLVLCHRKELIDQAVFALECATGESIGVEQGLLVSQQQRIVVGSVQTVYREHRFQHMQAMGGFDTLVIDEGHHYLAPTYKAAVDAFPNAHKLYVSATPERGDHAAMGQIIDTVAYKFDILDGIKAGYLTPFEGRQVFIKEINLADVKTTRGDLDQSQLDIQVCKGVESIVATVLKEWPNRRGLAFFPKKRSARLACERFNAAKPGCAACVDDDTEEGERKQIISDCHAGKYQFLCGVMIFTEGFDWPACDLIINARQTKSTSLYTQILGRGSRPLPGLVDSAKGPEGAEARRELIATSAKPRCIVADFAGNAGKHRLCSPVDVLGGNFTLPEVTLAKKLEKEESDGDEPKEAQDYLTMAREQLLELARLMQGSTVSHTIRVFSPFGVLNMKTVAPNVLTDKAPATVNQVNALVRLTGESSQKMQDMSKVGASRLLGNLAIRRKFHLATYQQLKTLKEHGIDNTRISIIKANSAMEYLRGKPDGEACPNTLRHICGVDVPPTKKKRKARTPPALRRHA